jgi:predicted TIM-barrel fold metal-dependent hydrolase
VPCPAAGGPQARGALDTRAQNDTIAEACRRFPERFPIGLAILEVRHQQAAADEIARCMDEAGLHGLMVHPSLSASALGPELRPALEVVDARGGLALLHVGGGGYEVRAAAHAKQFKRTTFVMAHVSMRREHFPAAVEHLAGVENVWVDFAQHPAVDDETWDLAAHVRHFGADRLLFGSDAPYYDWRRLQRQVEESRLDEATKDAIAWRNAESLIRRFRPEWRMSAAPVELVGEWVEWAATDLWRTLPGQPARLA